MLACKGEKTRLWSQLTQLDINNSHDQVSIRPDSSLRYVAIDLLF